MGAEDQLPQRALDAIRALQFAATPSTEQLLSKSALLELFLAWISELCQKGVKEIPLPFSKATLLRRLWLETQDSEASILPLKGFELNNFSEFLQKRLAPWVQRGGEEDSTKQWSSSVRACLEFLCFGDADSHHPLISLLLDPLHDTLKPSVPPPGGGGGGGVVQQCSAR
eukprot:Protomagalhaensia_sp_Gyna_25__2896@NODE_2693_length_943_cov_4_353982_g2247_i0_p1_GENE_NODE_2693_length_943_cov_4_353982_g2247_i0NODE_2693_length_943_cov_4_353982_g2247_i0_p1_ORF_typecomplete_len170_score27_09_NODE_2693_length_943_cov_4_353982_g2247_i06515